MKIETETYVANLIFIKFPGITWNGQEFKAFLRKIASFTDTKFAANKNTSELLIQWKQMLVGYTDPR